MIEQGDSDIVLSIIVILSPRTILKGEHQPWRSKP